MSAKRFKMGESDIQGEMIFIDTQTNKIYWQEYFDEIVDLLNELVEENGQLKLVISKLDEDNTYYILENRRLKEKYDYDIEDYRQSNAELQKENEQLKEQLQMIERIIQTQIIEKEEDLRISVKGGMPTGGLYSEIGFLKKLKKKCFDE